MSPAIVSNKRGIMIIVVKSLDKKLLALQDIEKLPLRYLKKRNVFVNYKESCAFDPVTGDGHSYRWYALTKVINGVLVLNTYSYSNQTAKHVSKVRSLLKLLGVKFVEVQAPKGLQDLDAAQLYIARLYGRAVIEKKYARKPSNWAIDSALLQIKNGEKIGMRFTKYTLAKAVRAAETERRERLDRAKVTRVQRAQINGVLGAIAEAAV